MLRHPVSTPVMKALKRGGGERGRETWRERERGRKRGGKGIAFYEQGSRPQIVICEPAGAKRKPELGHQV
jgi:hypothetical protein